MVWELGQNICSIILFRLRDFVVDKISTGLFTEWERSRLSASQLTEDALKFTELPDNFSNFVVYQNIFTILAKMI